MGAQVTANASQELPRLDRRRFVALGLGNTVEFYDFVLFGLLAAFIGPQFFAATDPISATLSALAVFGVGFAVRPLGGIVLGLVADRVGRRFVLLLSILTMSLSTLVVAISPTYEQIGGWASLILLVCRCVQGMSAGIEAPLATAYAVELAPPGGEGRAAGVMAFFVYIGTLLASLVSFVTSLVIGTESMQEWGWRLPLLFGAALGVLVVYMRRTLPESLREDEKAGTAVGVPPTVWAGVRANWLGVVAVFFIVAFFQGFVQAWTVGLPSLARGSFEEDATAIFAVATASNAILVVGSLITGRLADRYRVSRVFLAGRWIGIPSVLLMLLYTGPSIATFSIVTLIGSVALAMTVSTFNIVASSMLPKYCRATGVATGYNVASALVGGTAPYLLVWLQQVGLFWIFPFYVAAIGLVSIPIYQAARRSGRVYMAD